MMNKQNQLRAVLTDIKLNRDISWREAKLYACGLLAKSPLTMEAWLSKNAQDIPDNELERLQLKWGIEKIS